MGLYSTLFITSSLAFFQSTDPTRLIEQFPVDNVFSFQHMPVFHEFQYKLTVMAGYMPMKWVWIPLHFYMFLKVKWELSWNCTNSKQQTTTKQQWWWQQQQQWWQHWQWWQPPPPPNYFLNYWHNYWHYYYQFIFKNLTLLTIPSLSWLFCLDKNKPDLQKNLSHGMDVAGMHESLNVPLLDKPRSSI